MSAIGAILGAVCLALHCGSPAVAAGGDGKAASTLAAEGPVDLDGKAVEPFANSKEAKTTVLVFLSCECPISNRYAPELRRLREHFATNTSASFWLVYPNRDETNEAIRKHTNEFQLPMNVLRDPQHLLVKRAKVTVTPEAAVFGPKGDLVYHGRIDNRYVAFGKERPQATEHDLEEVLTQVTEGKTGHIAPRKAVGCYISDR